MAYFARSEPDLFAILFWGSRLIAGNHAYQLGEITTEYLNMDIQPLRTLGERVDALVPIYRQLLDHPDPSQAVAVQEKLNDFYDVLLALPPYRDLKMNLNISYDLFPLLADQPEKWTEAMTVGTPVNTRFREILFNYETLPERLNAFRTQVALMLELDFEKLRRRNGAAYGRAFSKYYHEVRAMAPFFFPDGDVDFQQSFDAAIRFIPIRNPDDPEEVVIGEETQFQDLASFLYTDFYRGLIRGNAPRRCHNCGRYFLLTAGYNTCYCNNIAPGETERTCRKVGAHRKEAKGKANRTPAQREYERAYNRLKSRKNRGKIDVDEWNAAVAQAQELRDRSERGELTDEELREKLNQL